MGIRFTLESANTIANLTFGNLMSCYRDIYSSKERFDEFIDFLDQFNENLYSYESNENSSKNEQYNGHIIRIKETILSFEYHRYLPLFETEHFAPVLPPYRDVLTSLQELSIVFRHYVNKSLLLPKMMDSSDNSDNSDDFMTSVDTLRHLVKISHGARCLILQPKERPRVATIFSAFPNFDVTLRQADLWPAVLFWDDHDEYAFVPINDEKELFYLYEIFQYERHPILEIKRIAAQKKKATHYLFQLSDLHFGAKNVAVAERRLKSLVKAQKDTMDLNDSVNFLITGDVVDSPINSNESDYRDFSDYIEECYGTKPIRVLGNHDVNGQGLVFSHVSQQIANIVGEYPKVQKLDELKVILLLFNSNTNGHLAQGEIGQLQMAEMGNLLDRVDELDTYTLIAVLHHHLFPIPQPDFYDRKWYMKILPQNFLEESLRLVDADLFLDWLKLRNIKLVLHGHKHIPFMIKQDGIIIISCGSSTGQITHKEKGKTYISYNLLKINKNVITCTQFAEEVFGAGATNIRTETIYLC